MWKAVAKDIRGMPGDTEVAVKTLKDSAGYDEQKDLLQELKVLKDLGTHPHVVSLLGCCTEKGNELLFAFALRTPVRTQGAERSVHRFPCSILRILSLPGCCTEKCNELRFALLQELLQELKVLRLLACILMSYPCSVDAQKKVMNCVSHLLQN